MAYKLGLLGGKLGHSFSPLIHQYIFNKMNIEASYSLIECQENEVEGYLKKLREGEYFAFNVTIPYKQTVMPYLDEISEEALKIGAVNTVTMKNGKLVGYNTDYFGFINSLSLYKIDVKNHDVLVLGCGGAAKALVYGLLDLGANVTVAIREEDVLLSKWYDNVILFSDIDKEKIDIIVNATPVGMYPNVEAIPIKEELIKCANVVFDVIYNPLETKMMKLSNRGYNGLYMLVLQAIKADEIFFDIKVNDEKDVYDYVLKEVL